MFAPANFIALSYRGVVTQLSGVAEKKAGARKVNGD